MSHLSQLSISKPRGRKEDPAFAYSYAGGLTGLVTGAGYAYTFFSILMGPESPLTGQVIESFVLVNLRLFSKWWASDVIQFYPVNRAFLLESRLQSRIRDLVHSLPETEIDLPSSYWLPEEIPTYLIYVTGVLLLYTSPALTQEARDYSISNEMDLQAIIYTSFLRLRPENTCTGKLRPFGQQIKEPIPQEYEFLGLYQSVCKMPGKQRNISKGRFSISSGCFFPMSISDQMMGPEEGQARLSKAWRQARPKSVSNQYPKLTSSIRVTQTTHRTNKVGGSSFSSKRKRVLISIGGCFGQLQGWSVGRDSNFISKETSTIHALDFISSFIPRDEMEAHLESTPHLPSSDGVDIGDSLSTPASPSTVSNGKRRLHLSPFPPDDIPRQLNQEKEIRTRYFGRKEENVQPYGDRGGQPKRRHHKRRVGRQSTHDTYRKHPRPHAGHLQRISTTGKEKGTPIRRQESSSYAMQLIPPEGERKHKNGSQDPNQGRLKAQARMGKCPGIATQQKGEED
ncbi:hypothetical protein QYF36_000602 [Acer negundo]|nr:hypothetical protein QYF36_000602 [Acer negundo]